MSISMSFKLILFIPSCVIASEIVNFVYYYNKIVEEENKKETKNENN